MTNEVEKGKNVPTDIHPNDLNDLIYVMNQNIKQVPEEQKKRDDSEGSTSNVSRPIVRPVVHGGTSSHKPTCSDPVSMVPLLTSSMVPGGNNFEGPGSPLSVSDMDPMLPPVFPPMTPQMDSSMSISSIDASMPMNNNQNYSIGFPQGPALSDWIDWNNDHFLMKGQSLCERGMLCTPDFPRRDNVNLFSHDIVNLLGQQIGSVPLALNL
ncbi:hypothetical protein HAX54_051817 [Datura stramonium]|uniref:Uncharacterized protein n=1 Tax=Datura stramonium TaxID=4076 RepID=A0ABS8RRH3_DATST|nr:hypothetical protein [Datura stramonium]